MTSVVSFAFENIIRRHCGIKMAGFGKCSLIFLPEITAIIKLSRSNNTLASRQIPCKLLNYNVLKGTTEMRPMNSKFSFIAQRNTHRISNVSVRLLSSSGWLACAKPSSLDIPRSTKQIKTTVYKSTRNFKTEASDRVEQDRNRNDDIPSWVS